MKKTLVALAALAATSAFAQVTITGNIDFAYSSSTGTNAISNGKTIATSTGTSSTSAIKFAATEDLGGGMKATAFYAIDPRTLANDGLSTTNNTQAATTPATTQGAATVTGLNRDEMYVALTGNFGALKLGSPNSIGLGVAGDASPLGTAMGSGYTGLASGTMMNSVVQTRYNRSVRFDTPTMAGFTASVLYAPGNDVASATPSSVTGGTSTALPIPNNRAATEFGLKYAAGPLTASVGQIKQDAQVNKTGYYSGDQAAAAQQVATSATIYAINYKIGDTTLYIGGNSGDRLAAKSSSAGAKVESKGTRLAIKQTIGQFDLIAQQTTQDTTGASADTKAKVTGLRADYNLSKTAAAYIGYAKITTGTPYVTTAALASGDLKTVAIGMRKSF
jgi:predicted porin